uniref:Uncharacterized protein n=1 Tax=Cyclopterus lumpus TaxID=8103 RepID=A0A8C3AI00_CYCLU
MRTGHRGRHLSELAPSWHDEDEAVAAENALRAAITTAVDALCGACSRRVRECQSTVADRDREIARLEGELEKSEVRWLSLQLGCGPTEGEPPAPGTSEERGPRHGEHGSSWDDGSVGATAPTHFSPECHDTDEALPHQHNPTEEPSWEAGRGAGDQPFGCLTSLVKEESSDLETDVKWEECERSLLDQHGAEYLHEETPAKEGVLSAHSDAGHSDMEEDFLSSPQTLQETRRVTTRRSRPSASRSPVSSPSDGESSSSLRQLGNDWHHHFQVSWNMLPTALRKKLDNQERPTAKERRGVIRIIAAEILFVCQNPSKKHLEEVARKMVLAYPKSFKDIMEDEVVGSGYDSVTKQLQCRVDNCKRKKTLCQQKSTSGDGSNGAKNPKRQRASYGCIQWESGPVNVEAQMKKKRRMQIMFLENEGNEKRVEQLMSDTFVSQRNDIRADKDTRALKEEWPYLFSLVGIKAHFRLLTGVDVDERFEEAMATKFARVLDYFRSRRAARRRADIPAAGGPCGAVLMLLSHFKEDFERMFHVWDRTCIADAVRTERLPHTPCVVACGASPMSAAAFMLAVDREVIIEDVASFTDALVGMFACYYVFNLRYPAELGATMEFLQRWIHSLLIGDVFGGCFVSGLLLYSDLMHQTLNRKRGDYIII